MIGHVLTDKETELLLEVLGEESRRLMVEARRTDAAAMHSSLRERLRAVDRLVERLQELREGELKA